MALRYATVLFVPIMWRMLCKCNLASILGGWWPNCNFKVEVLIGVHLDCHWLTFYKLRFRRFAVLSQWDANICTNSNIPPQKAQLTALTSSQPFVTEVCQSKKFLNSIQHLKLTNKFLLFFWHIRDERQKVTADLCVLCSSTLNPRLSPFWEEAL